MIADAQRREILPTGGAPHFPSGFVARVTGRASGHNFSTDKGYQQHNIISLCCIGAMENGTYENGGTPCALLTS